MNKVIKPAAIICLVLITTQIILNQTKPFGKILDGISYSKVFLDSNGKLLRLSISEDEKYRLFKPLDEISEYSVKSALIYEDKFFYYHFGVNPFSLLRAFYKTYVSKERKLGASTITMQVSRNLYKINTRTPKGKIKQILGALWLEFLYSKKEILEAYLNIVPYGYNIEGVAAASLIYYQKQSLHLSLIEALTLTVIPQSPYERTKNLVHDKKANASLLSARKNLVKAWNKSSRVNLKDHARQKDFDLSFSMLSPKDLPFEVPHLIDEFNQMRSSQLEYKFSIDLGLQKKLESVGKNYLNNQRNKKINNYSALLIDAETMKVKAQIGSANFYDSKIHGQVNGVKAKRSPGSALKPFVYALAVDQGHLHQKTMLIDAPTPFGTYTPDNFDYNFAGPISMHHSLIYSRNIPALLVAQKLKNPSFYNFLKSGGVDLSYDQDHYGLSIVLGAAELDMEELVELYALFVNGGRYKKISKLSRNKRAKGEQLISPEASFLIRDTLHENAPPEEDLTYKWKVNLEHVAWKTGTSMGHRDAWSVGVFDKYVLAVWVGNFSGAGDKSFVGRDAAGPLFFRFIDTVIDHTDIETFRPSGFGLNLSKVEVCALSGKLAKPFCKHKEKTWFIPGVSPIHTCDVHRKIKVDLATNLRTCPERTKAPFAEKVYEYWPSEILELYRQAGMDRLKPPSFHEDCLSDRFGKPAPRILSPKEGVSYTLRSRGEDAKKIPFIARGDGDIKKFEWFVNNLSVGFSKPDRPFLWSSTSGLHEVRVQDDQGNSTSKTFKVEWVE